MDHWLATGVADQHYYLADPSSLIYVTMNRFSLAAAELVADSAAIAW